jgi:hypothetical protein
MRSFLVTAALVALLLGLAAIAPGAAAPSPHYVPAAGDGFHYEELTTVTDGVGDYQGYTDQTTTTGSIGVTAIAPNGTESADYQSSFTYTNNDGASGSNSTSGTFTFSAVTYHYVRGSDNQTGYVNPFVWFYMNNTLPVGASFYLLNTEMTIESLNSSYAVPTTSTGYAKAIEADGSGSYQRSDSYGTFTATYTWVAYFDPSTGYIIGYVDTEQDRNASGDGFTYTDTLTVSSTSYPLTAAPPPPSPPPTGGSSPTSRLAVIVVVVVVVVLVAVLAVALGRRRASSLPRHSGPVGGAPPAWTPPPLTLGGGGGPAPQVVLRETVKVNCRYCGTLMDSTATVCPKCGAPRT